MRPLIHKIKPANGFSQVVHQVYRLALPVLVFVLVRLGIGLWLPILVILLSKWRIFAVRPRFWPANLRANSIDIMFGISMVLFMDHADAMSLQLLWAAVYAVWLLFIKPRSSMLFVSLQAAIGQLAALTVLCMIAGRPLDGSFMNWTFLPVALIVFCGGLICYLTARHFFDSFNEPYAKMLAYVWGYFGAALFWLLSHMLIMYPNQDGTVAMPTLLLSAIGYSLGAVYYLEHFDKLSPLVRRELLFLGGAVVLILAVSLFYEGAHLIV